MEKIFSLKHYHELVSGLVKEAEAFIHDESNHERARKAINCQINLSEDIARQGKFIDAYQSLENILPYIKKTGTG